MLLVWLSALGWGAVGADQPRLAYATPPRCLVWLQGEDCRDHNWREGPVDNCWAFDWAGVHGGVLDLASWRLPGAGECFYARFPFEVPQAGGYVLYYLGRIPGVLASPLEWSVDDGPAAEVLAPDGWNLPGALDVVASFKYCLAKLGTVQMEAGAHSLCFRVRKAVGDFGIAEMYSAQIDAVGLAPADWAVEPAPLPIGPPAPSPLPTGSAPDDAAREALCLRADALGAEVSPVNGGLRRLSFGADGLTLAAVPLATPLLTVERRDGSVVESGAVVGVTQTESALLIETHAPGLKVAAKWTADRQTGELRLRVWVRNLGGASIWRVRLNLAGGLAIGGDARDDAWLVGKELLSPDKSVGEYSWVSPHQFPFDLAAIGDRAASVYALLEDRELLNTRVEFGRASETAAGRLAFTKHPRIRPGETWAAPPLCLGAYSDGDWHRAGDRFSRWWYSWARTPRTPGWLAAIGGLSLGGPDLQKPDAVATGLQELATAERVSGISLLHGAGWLGFATECWYPLQYRLTADRLRSVRTYTDALRAAGGRSSFYTNPLMLSRATPDYELWGRGLATIDSRGRVQLTEHATHHHPMCLPYPSAAWANRYLEAVEAAVVAGKPDMLYMDQLGAVPAHLDFAPDEHGHRHFGEWTRGSAEFLRSVTTALAPFRPDLGTYIECPNPVLQQYVHLSFYGTNRVLRYVFPTYYGFVGSVDAVSPEKALATAQEALLTGEAVTIHYASLTEATPEQQQAVRDIIALKQTTDPLLRHARFRDSQGLEPPPGVEATVFEGPDAAYVAYVNREAVAGQSVRLRQPPGTRSLRGEARAWMVGRPEVVRPAVRAAPPGRLSVALPEAPAGILELR
jgi:hypothetical protein